MSTYMEKKGNVVRKWYVVDAAGKPLGKTQNQKRDRPGGAHRRQSVHAKRAPNDHGVGRDSGVWQCAAERDFERTELHGVGCEPDGESGADAAGGN